MKTGVLLIQLGTPDAPNPSAIRRYLRQFLWDRRVLNMPAPLRAILLYGFILPFRPGKVAHAYRQIWSQAGSPLLVHTRALSDGLAARLGEAYDVRFAMRYGRPSIADEVERLRMANIDRLVVIPLYPHYASSTVGSSLEALMEAIGRNWNLPSIRVVPPFHGHPAYQQALKKRAEPFFEQSYDHVLFSYHGLPENHLTKDQPQPVCLANEHCCERLHQQNAFCYRAQCLATSRAVAAELGIQDYSSAFQSRVGRGRWIRPFTDEVVERLPQEGVRRLAVFCLSFTADCLETLEEIGIRARDAFQAAGGSELTLIPALNAEAAWVEALAAMIGESE